MPTVPYMTPMQGFRPKTNPRGSLGLYGLRGLGDGNTFSGCVSALDSNGNPVACSDPSAAIWMDANGNAVPPGTPVGSSAVAANTPAAPTAGGAATGSLLLYQGTWQVTPTLNVNTIISQVSSAVRAYGLQVVGQQNSGSVLTIGNFNVALTLQVIGSGFAQPSDAGSIVDHAYYTVTGHMPVMSGTLLQAPPGAPVPALPGTTTAPTGTPAPTAQPTTFMGWLQQDALWIAIVIGAVFVGREL